VTSMLRSPGTGSTGMARFAISSRAECWKLAHVEVAGAGISPTRRAYGPCALSFNLLSPPQISSTPSLHLEVGPHSMNQDRKLWMVSHISTSRA